MVVEKNIDASTPAETARILNLFWLGLLLRLVLVLVFHVTDVEQTLNLTNDASLYDRVGRKIAEYYRSGGESSWPVRVSGFIEHLYEHFVGVTYYLTGDSVLAVRALNALSGSLVILVTWRMARYFTDAETAYRSGLWACFFPTLFYYSCLPVRDAQSTLGMALVFLGLTAITSAGKFRHTMALPLGLLLMTGYRAYVAVALFILIPISWLLTLLASRTRQNRQLACRNMLVALLIGATAVPIAVSTMSSTRKTSMVTRTHSWNKVRQHLNSGSGALYEDHAVPSLGESVSETTQSVVIGLYFFFLSVNPVEMGSVRQWMALPEGLIVLYMMPSLFRGLSRVMRHHRFEFISVLFVVVAITLAYSSMTTNAGPLMRWRLQVINVYIVVVAIGFARTCSSESGENAPRLKVNQQVQPATRVANSHAAIEHF